MNYIRFTNVITIIIWGIVGSLSSLAKADDEEWRLSYPNDGVTLGQGWHILPGKAADAYCIEFAPPTTAGTPQVVNTDAREIRSQETVRQHLTYGQDIGVKFLFDFSSKYDSTTIATNVLDFKSYSIVVRVENSPETIRPTEDGPVRLKDKYVELLKSGKKGVEKFVKECGESYVYRRTGGADISALTTFKSLTLEEQNKSEIKLGGSGKIDGFSLTVSNSEMNDAQLSSLRSSLDFRYTLRGGNSSVGATNAESLTTLIATLPKLAADAAKYWHMDIKTYASLTNFPKNATIGQLKVSASVALSQYLRLREIIDYTSFALSYPMEFESISFNAVKLKEINTDATNRLSLLNKVIETCNSDNMSCADLPQTDDIWDYQYRVYFPIRTGFTQIGRDLNTSIGAKRIADKRVAEIWNIVNKPNYQCNFDPSGYAPGPLLTEIVNLCKNVLPPLNNRVNLLTLQMPSDIKRATRSILRATRDDRCRPNPIGPLCLSQTKLEEIESLIEARQLP